jgi:integrating conjugative element protein (TIGR03758 family)
MSLSGDQLTAFQSNGGFAPGDCATLLVGGVFVVLLVWGVWALRTAYTGWAAQRITQRQLVAVAVRFLTMYVVLTFFLLS